MKVSIITVCLNSQSTISDTIKSVLSQDYKDIEYKVFYGGSSDGTINILTSYNSKIKLVRGSDNGIFDAMNQSIGYATGEVIGLLNSDDFYSNPQVISRVVASLQANSVDAVFGDLDLVAKSDVSKVRRKWRSSAYSRNDFL